MKSISMKVFATVIAFTLSAPLFAVYWTTDFASNPSPVILAGNASYQTINGSRCVRLTQNIADQEGWFMVNQPCGQSGEIEWFDVRWTQCLSPYTGVGKGVCFAFGPFGNNPDIGTPTNYGGSPNPGLKIIWRQANDTLYVMVNGEMVASIAFDPDTGDTFKICRVSWWRSTGRLRINCYGGTTRFDQSVSLDPELNWKFNWGGDGGTFGNHGQTAIDDIAIYTGTSLTEPATGFVYKNTNPFTWQWNAPTDYGIGISRYDVNISNGSANIHSGSTGNTFYSFDVPASGIWYSGQVRAVGIGHSGALFETTWSEWSSPTLFDNQPPVLSAPANPTSPYSNTGNITFNWPAAVDPGGSGMKQYYLHIWRTDIPWGNPGSDVGPGLISNNTSYTFTGGQTGITYRAWVYGIDNAGNWGYHSWGNGCLVDKAVPVNATATCPAYANTSPINVSYSGASDAHSGIDGVYLWFKKDSGQWTNTGQKRTTESGTFSFVPTGDGRYYFACTTTDKAGNSTANPTGNGNCSVLFDTAAPSGSILINNGDESTVSKNVTLSITASDNGSGIKEMRFSNDSASWSSWEPFASNKEWQLTGNSNEIKTVYCMFKDQAGNESAIVSDSIMLYEQVPPGQKGVVDGIGLNNIGTLIKTAGRFTYINSSEFGLNDGSYSVSVIVPPSVTINPNWVYVVVTGISSTRMTEGGMLQRVVRVSNASDILAY